MKNYGNYIAALKYELQVSLCSLGGVSLDLVERSQ